MRPYKRVASAKFRLEPNSPKILRFFGRWEDKETRLLNVHFYLEDETIEIVENHDTNCGRYKAPMFLKRCRLPKVLKLSNTQLCKRRGQRLRQRGLVHATSEKN